MFKKLKDKLAEEVKSSPQRIQQFAQAAQVSTDLKRLHTFLIYSIHRHVCDSITV